MVVDRKPEVVYRVLVTMIVVIALLVALSIAAETGRYFTGYPHFCGGVLVKVSCEGMSDFDTIPAAD